MSVYVIAEAGVNHNGSLELAKELIDVASESGANAVCFKPSVLLSLLPSVPERPLIK